MAIRFRLSYTLFALLAVKRIPQNTLKVHHKGTKTRRAIRGGALYGSLCLDFV
jgi:hypothetical protein